MKIEVKNVTKRFKNNTVLDNINLTFESGNIYSLVGRNGSGKSVLLKILCAFYYPTIGTVTFDEKNYIEENSFPENTRALIEHPSFIDTLTGFENLKTLAKIQNIITDEEILETLKLVNLYEERDKLYFKYSLGMKQKLGLAQAFMEKPDILILDEPFNGVEEETVIKLREYLIKLKEEGKLIILATHIKEDLEMITDITYKLVDGKLEKKDLA